MSKTLIASLAEKGWKISTHFTDEHFHAVKSFATAVGVREGIIYFRDGTLTAEYLSEGQNVASTCHGTEAEVGQFVRDVERYIDDSYARRLYLGPTMDLDDVKLNATSIENVQNPEWGTFGIREDHSGYFDITGSRGSRVLDKSEAVRFWRIVHGGRKNVNIR